MVDYGAVTAKVERKASFEVISILGQAPDLMVQELTATMFNN